MTWFKVDDGLAVHPKVLAAGNMAMGLWVRAGSWCAANLTDGHLPRTMIAPLDGRKRDADRLIKAGLWIETSGGYQFVDWSDWQPTKEQVRADREATKKRVSRWREQHRNDVTNDVTNGVTNTVGNGATNAAPTRPVPSRSGLGSQSLPAVETTGQPDGLNLDRIKTALRCDLHRAELVSEQILAKAPRPPGNPTAYVISAINTAPHLYRQTSGPPAIGDICDEHGRDRATCPPSWHQEQP